MRITALKAQARSHDRVNVFIDGKYSFSLDMSQVVSLGVKVGNEYDATELSALKDESLFGKLYMRALEYVLMRPRSRREVGDYLYRKTRPTRTRMGGLKEGYSKVLTDRVFQRLIDKGYVDDAVFARYWVENRNVRKGISARKLRGELMQKGVESSIIDEVMSVSTRDEADDLQKIIAKKISKYDDEQKLIAYLARQGFGFEDIRNGIDQYRENTRSF